MFVIYILIGSAITLYAYNFHVVNTWIVATVAKAKEAIAKHRNHP